MKGVQMLDRALRRVIILLPVAGAAFGQVATSPPTAPDNSGALQEVVVTAQKHAENLQSVPIAVQAFSENQLKAVGITSTDDLAVATPGLVMTRNVANVSPYIRGVGMADNLPGFENAVAFYVDGVYYTQSSDQVMSLADVERVEVLKGPQGTLYGRNATGGLIQVITKDPAATPGATVSADYGNYNTVSTDFYGTTALVENIAANLAVHYSDQSDGWGRNVTTGGENLYGNNLAARSKVLFAIDDETTLRLALDYSRSNSDFGVDYRPYPYVLGPLGASNYAGFYNTESYYPPLAIIKNWGAAGTLEHHFGSISFKSISAYRGSEQTQHFDLYADPQSDEDVGLHATDAQVTQEFDLASRNSSWFNWILGAFYMHDVVRYNGGGFSVFGNLSAIPGGLSYNRLFSITSTQPLNSYSGFAETYFQVTPTTKVTLGVRETDDRRSIQGVQGFDPLFAAIAGAPNAIGYPKRSRTDSGTTWRSVVDHNLTEDAMIYGSISRGFKSGAYNSGEPGAAPVLPETLTAYEIGAKTQWFDNRLRVNVAGYHYDYKNIQELVVVALNPTLVNAGAARINGVEIEGAASLNRELQLTFGANYLDAKFISFPEALITAPLAVAPYGNLVTTGSATGNALEKAPKDTMNVGLRYTTALGGGEWQSSVNYFHTSDFFWEPDNRLRQPGYGLLNAQMSWSTASNAWSFRIWGKDLTDEQYYQYGISEAEGDFGTPAPPRTYGVGVTCRF